ncbi:hypothetical protein BIW11_03564 [Tropilaelaps mercedesae]|uniref:Uncharacterized protein n=1 Tax=Tropilaelaps mercedesae TaxID=418985 RepID=A0A1V9XJA2_9ACAR|nr:hypothetical protein BIW11_03564 [Tropilaelaps mercedesae]
MQAPTFRLVSLDPSRSTSTTIMVNGDVLTQGSSYVILGDRAFAIQHLDVHMPRQYKYPTTKIVIDITVSEENGGYTPKNKPIGRNQTVKVLYNGEEFRNEFALVLQNKTIPPANIFIKVNGIPVLGEITLDAITYHSSDTVGTELPLTETATFQMNGEPVEPYTFSVMVQQNAAPVQGITVTDIRGRPLNGVVDIEVVKKNTGLPHAITLVNGDDSGTSYSILVKGKEVPANDLVFKVNGKAQMVIVDFAVSRELIRDLKESSRRVAVVPSRKWKRQSM